MSRATADELWGEHVVEAALAEPSPDPATFDLVTEIHANADPPGAFRAWALSQAWPRFCTIVRVVCGTIREEVERHGQE